MTKDIGPAEIAMLLEQTLGSAKLVAFAITFSAFVLKNKPELTAEESELLDRLLVAQIAIRQVYSSITNDDIRAIADRVITGAEEAKEPEPA